MQFIDLKTQYNRIKEKVDSSVLNVLDHGRYVFGPEITELEEKLADYAGVKHALACSSGTDALLIPLMAMEIGPGDAIFTTSFTFVATAEVVCLTGATPIFVDIDPVTFNMDPNKLEEALEYVKRETELTPKIVMPVDLFGIPADFDPIISFCEKHDLTLIEDAAQGFGAKYKGKTAGSFGKVSGTSFYPAKPLGCYGDGGATFTNDDDLYEKFKSIRVHGMGGERYDNIRLGINGRMDSMQAAVLLAKLDIFDEEIELRNQVANRYNNSLTNVTTPSVPEGCSSVWAQYSVLAESGEHREELISKLKDHGIPTAIFYPIPLHRQTAYKQRGLWASDLTVSDDCSQRIFSLPMHPYLKEEDQEKIASVIG